MEIHQIYERIHRVITEKIKGGEIKLLRSDIQNYASLTSAELIIIIGNPTESKENKLAAKKALFAISMAEKDLEDNLAK
jgi:hypothetical protein